jgi:hypothetical protein
VKPSMLWILALAGAAILLACLVLGAASSSARTLRDESAPSACTAGPHGGEITADQTWCAADSPHIVGETLTVAVGAVLTIEAGAEVRVADYAAIDVLGRLEAPGTDASPITFTAKDSQWRGLAFAGGSASGLLRHVTVRRGGLLNPTVGSYAEVTAYNVSPGQVLLEDSLVTEVPVWNSGHVFGINVMDSNFVMSGTTVSGAGCCGDDTAVSISGAGAVATLSRNTFTGNPGTTLKVSGAGQATISHNDFHGNSLAMSVAGDNVLVENNQIYDNGGSSDPRGGIRVGGGSPTIIGNVLRNNRINDNGAISVGSGSPLLINNVIVGNHADYRCSAIYIQQGSAPVFRHTTIAGNDGGDGSAICMAGQYAGAQFYNTIIADEAVGVQFAWPGSLEMHNTLWDNVTTKTGGDAGTLTEVASIYGKALFDLDGYHLTRNSRAIGLGADVGVETDIDGEARPSPAGSAPDIGADEYPVSQAPAFWLEFYSEDPRLEATASGGVRVEQDFYLFFNYGSEEANPPDLPITIANTLPAEMEYQSEQTTGSGGFIFEREDQALSWHTQWPVKVNESGYVRYTIAYQNVQPGQTVDNTVHVTAGPDSFMQTVSTEIPFFPPKITYPIDGESCPGLNNTVLGYATPGSIVRLYEDGIEKQFTVASDEDGRFEFTYASDKVGVNLSTTLTVASCNRYNPYDCSKPSKPVVITKQLGFWCPTRSFWDGYVSYAHGVDINRLHMRFGFRNTAGQAATDNWYIFGGRAFEDTTLSLHLCTCSETGAYPTGVYALVNGVRYDPAGGTSVKTFSITPAGGPVEFHGWCGTSEKISKGTILIDPDGFVFDVTKGFDPEDPTLHALAGMTVTLLVDEPDLGGWVQWPAHLYEQVNPQVTGNDGYYAFYTPPGKYYVRVTGADGFQSWRSPLITVKNELVHLNVPLTPISSQNVQVVNLTVTGPDRPVVHVKPGDTVEWSAEMIPNISPESRRLYTENPVLRLLSALDPLSDTLGFDSGMIAPGQSYRRRFDEKGVSFYDDGLGHTGRVMVGIVPVYLPVVLR